MLPRTALHSLAGVEEHHTRRALCGENAAGHTGQAGIRAGEQRLPTIHKTIHLIAVGTRGCAPCKDRGQATDTAMHILRARLALAIFARDRPAFVILL